MNLSALQPKEGFVPRFLHFDLSDHSQEEDHWVFVNGERHDLVSHTEESRATLKSTAPHLADHSHYDFFTHYTHEPLYLPSDQVIRIMGAHSLKSRPDLGVEWMPTFPKLIIPRAHEEGDLKGGIPETVIESVGSLDTAKALIYHHPDLLSKNPDLQNTLEEYYDKQKGDPAIRRALINLARKIKSLGETAVPEGESGGWAELIKREVPAFVEIDPTDKPTTAFQIHPRKEVRDAAVPLMRLVLKKAKNDIRFKDKAYVELPKKDITDFSKQGEIDEIVYLGDSKFSPELTVKDKQFGTKIKISEKGEAIFKNEKEEERTALYADVEIANYYSRYLGVYAVFYDAHDKIIETEETCIKNSKGLEGEENDEIPDNKWNDFDLNGYIRGAAGLVGLKPLFGYQ